MKPTSFSVLEKGIHVLQGMNKEKREKKKHCKKNRRNRRKG